DRALLQRVRRPADRRVRAAVALLRSGQARIADVAARVNVGDRQLERLFREHVGVAPKAYARVMRVQSLVRALDDVSCVAPSWADLAVAHGFADQAHLIRDVRALAGVTPTALLRERTGSGIDAMSEMFNPKEQPPDTLGA
ncbi:MAG TPA: helix-turn-helix domain-containing protein, partial [Myxococcota bacterium]